MDDTGTVTIAGHTVLINKGFKLLIMQLLVRLSRQPALSVGMQVVQEVAVDVRKNTMNNHTANTFITGRID